MPFRVQAAKLFLTYSQCKLTRDEVKNHLEVVGGKMREYIIVREHHEEQGTHIHAAFIYEKKFDSKNSRCFDLKGIHPNIQPLKTQADFQRVWDYCKKEDPEPLICQLSKSRAERNQEVYKELMSIGPDKLMQEGKIHPIQYSGYKRTYTEHLAAISSDEREELPAELENPWTKNFQVDLDIKKCHLWLYSHKPNQGKTTWADALCSKYRAEFYNYTETFQAQIFPSTEILLLDEFRGQLKVFQLNQLCDGKMFFTKKGQPNFRLNQKPLVIVLSNRTIEEVYKNALDVSYVHARFMEMETILPTNIV